MGHLASLNFVASLMTTAVTGSESFVDWFMDSDYYTNCSLVVPSKTAYPTHADHQRAIKQCRDGQTSDIYTGKMAFEKNYLLTRAGVIGDILASEKPWNADPMTCAEQCFDTPGCVFWQFGLSESMDGFVCLNASYKDLEIAMREERIVDTLHDSQRQWDCGEEPTSFVGNADEFTGHEQNKHWARISGFADEWTSFCRSIYTPGTIWPSYSGDWRRREKFCSGNSYEDDDRTWLDCLSCGGPSCTLADLAFDHGFYVHDGFMEDFEDGAAHFSSSPSQCARFCWEDENCVWWQLHHKNFPIGEVRDACNALTAEQLRTAMMTTHDEYDHSTDGNPPIQRWCNGHRTSFVNNADYLSEELHDKPHYYAKFGGWKRNWDFETLCDYFRD